MPKCSAINFIGNICGEKSNELHYFWYYDPHGRLDKTFHICHKHSNTIIDDLMQKEKAYSNLIKACYDQIEKKRTELATGNNLTEQREAMRNAKDNGLPEPVFTTVQELKNKISDLYTKVSNAKKILVIERNRVCRWCKYPLKTPESPQDQIGKKYTTIDFKSPVGFRRLDAIFHTECAISWITNKIKLEEKDMKYIQPKRVGQQTIFSSV
jgi:hypothetical protein